MKRLTKGFTLIELMIVVAVIGILAGIAYPSYNQSVMKSRRADGQAMLLDVAQRQERFYTENNTYTTALSGASSLGYAAGTLKSEKGYYTITVAATAGSTIANSFTVTATPGGAQAGDTKCGNLTLTNTGVKGESGTASSAAECW